MQPEFQAVNVYVDRNCVQRIGLEQNITIYYIQSILKPHRLPEVQVGLYILPRDRPYHEVVCKAIGNGFG